MSTNNGPQDPQQPNEQFYQPQQQPYGYPQQPGQPGAGYPPPVQPKKAWYKRPWGIALIILLSLGLCGTIANATTSSTTNNTANTSTQATTQSVAPTDTPEPTPMPTQAPTWKSILSISGNGIKKTQSFTVSDDWKINYNCKGFNDGTALSGSMSIIVYNTSDNSMNDVAVNADCKVGAGTTDSTEEHRGGTLYLSINATGDWSIQVQSLQ